MKRRRIVIYNCLETVHEQGLPVKIVSHCVKLESNPVFREEPRMSMLCRRATCSRALSLREDYDGGVSKMISESKHEPA